MNILNWLLISTFLLSLNLINAQSIDAKMSKVDFDISNMGFKTVSGTFHGMKGDINFSPVELSASSFDVCTEAATIDTGNDKRDEHLRTEDFFDVEKYPNICFKSNSVLAAGDGYIAKGQLTLHGVTKEVEIPFTFVDNTFEGELKIERQNYEIGGKGKFLVGDEVNLIIICVVK